MYEIINKLRMRDESAQEKVYYLYLKLVKYLCHQHNVPEFDAYEIINDVFLKIFNNIDKFTMYDETSFKNWICKITNNVIIDYYRKHNNIQEEVIPDMVFKDHKNHLLIWELSKSLNDKQLNTLCNKIFFDKSYEDIATSLDCSSKTVYRNYKKALQILKEEYKKN